MNRKLIGTLVLSGLLLSLLIVSLNIVSLNIVQAAPVLQETQTADEATAAQATANEEIAAEEIAASEALTVEATSEPLSQPLTITIRQRLPISVDLSQLGLTSEGVTITGALPLALELTIQFRVTDTLTSTVPSTVTLMQIGDLLNRLPVSATLGNVTSTVVIIVPEPLTSTETLTGTGMLTGTEEITATPELTATAPITPEIAATPPVTTTPAITVTAEATAPVQTAPEVAATSNVTANLRAGPATTFDLVGRTSPGQELEIVAISNDAQWYLLSSGAWIFADLVSDPPADVPLATQELIDEVNAQAAREAEAEPTSTPVATPTPEAEESAAAPALLPTATPVPRPLHRSPTANVDANLRAGPGTQYAVVGGTITGQELVIVGQDGAGEWYLLNNGGWIATFLVDNAPADVPVVADDASPLLNGEQVSPILVPTPAPGSGTAATPASAAQEIPLGLAENLYLDEVRTLIARYDLTGDAILQLVAAAQADNAMIQDATWQEEMNTAIATMRRTGQQIRSLEPPPLFAAAQIDLRSASGAFDLAATLLEEGASEGAVEKLDQALAEAETGRGLLQSAQAKISAVAQ